MNAQQAREMAHGAKRNEVSLFSCLIAIRQAATNGESSVTIAGELSQEVKQKLESDGFKVRLLIKVYPGIDKTEISW